MSDVRAVDEREQILQRALEYGHGLETEVSDQTIEEITASWEAAFAALDSLATELRRLRLPLATLLRFALEEGYASDPDYPEVRKAINQAKHLLTTTPEKASE